VASCIAAQKDLWICVGQRYAEHLAHTALFNTSRLMSEFPPGTRIFAEGNSFFAELIFTLVCQSTDDPQLKVWIPARAGGDLADTNRSFNGYPNSLIATWVDADVTLILLVRQLRHHF